MPDDLTTPFLLLGAGFVAGTLNSIAGGGSLLTLPLLIFVGLPATIANGTNRIAILAGSVGATASFRARGLVPVQWLELATLPALLGVVLGTWGAVRIGDAAFERILAGVLVCAAAWIIWHPIEPPAVGDASPPHGVGRWLLRGAFFLLGAYSGFIQAGIGFFLLALTSANGLDLVRGNALKAPLLVVFTAVALTLFALNDMVDWVLGFTLASGQFFGARLGVRLQILKGQAWVRNVLTAAIIAFAIRLLVGG